MKSYGNAGPVVVGHHTDSEDEFKGLRTKASGRDILTDLERAHVHRSPLHRPTPSAPARVSDEPLAPPPAPPVTPRPPAPATAPARTGNRGSGAKASAQRIRDAGTTAARLRNWARDHGIDCPPAGPIPNRVIDAYLNGPPTTPTAPQVPKQEAAPSPAPPAADDLLEVLADHGAHIVDALLALANAIGDALDALPTTTTTRRTA